MGATALYTERLFCRLLVYCRLCWTRGEPDKLYVHAIGKCCCSCTGEDDASAALPCLATDGPTSWRDVGIENATCSFQVCVK